MPDMQDAENGARFKLNMLLDESFDKARDILKQKGLGSPLTIQFETTNHCNGKCEFCPHPRMTREKGYMSDEIFNRLVQEMKRIRPAIIMPFLQGEMFLDKKMIERLETLQQEFPEAKKYVFTNGSLLNDENITAVLKLSNLYFYLSLNAVDAASHRKITGLNNFDEIKMYADMFNLKQKDSRFIFKASFIDYSEYSHSLVPRFLEQWGASADVRCQSNYAGLCFDFKGAGRCIRPLDNMVVLWNGDVALCCSDMEGRVIFGNIMRNSLSEIWNSDALVKYRFCNFYSRREMLPLCSNCTGVR
ncbi:MAG: SPASM domain-containing protein [Nanoarchaeota archaeon]|nr:SPASM domain-containing protein [Nanoarchaeota archaeon]